MTGELTNAERKQLNRERKARLKSRAAPAGRTVKVAAEPTDPADRDGLVWLHKKQRITSAQAKEGFVYRDLFRQGGMGGAIRSNLPTGAVGGGVQSGLPFEDSFSDAAAQLALFVTRWNVLLGQSDLLTVMDGVCGVGHTLRYLAGGDQRRAAQLEAALRIGLDLMIASRTAKDRAMAKFSRKVA